MGWIHDLAREIHEEHARMVEMAVEEMLKRGHGGVKITWPAFGTSIRVELDDTIPYGMIYEFRE